MPIRILPPDLAAKIAAGEVIERPASVIKELVENAIDAGASEIHVAVQNGGKRLMRVQDDGCGILSHEVEMAFERHATSKLSSAQDLYDVRTLGFRGEALASIAAVSVLTLSTRSRDEQTGTTLRIEGGEVVHHSPKARAVGTTIQVENLFFNTPARLAFMRADGTETGHISRLVASYALAYPERRFSLKSGNRNMLRTNGTGELLDVIIALYGLDVAEQMIELEPSQSGSVSVSGLVGAPSLNRSNRNDIILFVNRRWIQDQSLSYAIREAYHSLLPHGRHPVVVLNVSVSPDTVDVNIHPTKREVRFRDQRSVFTAVQRAVRTALMAQHPVPVVTLPGRTAADWSSALPPQINRVSPGDPQLPLTPSETITAGPARSGLGIASRPTDRLPMLRVVGQISQTYIVAEGPGGMYLIDQHAAHERVRYEELTAQRAALKVPSQGLLDPVPIELSPEQSALLEANLVKLVDYGFDIEPFGETTFLVRRVPANLQSRDVTTAVLEMVDAALAEGDRFSWEDQTLYTLACHTAVRAGQTLSLAEMRDLIRQLEATSLPHACPHGRPTIMHMTLAHLEHQFGRR